ncbi:DJ-1/PfpI family protein [Terriglobus albidus]|uniref:DJ-1/PfpI family protein n=1 Tax=Terriglobus albidus TaxID=1592106 RepID=UPI001C9D3B82|nr:DJ-1/PfpI family protein [Terriglobus albidus]
MKMQVAILTFDGFNELDSFIAAGILNRIKPKGWNAYITCPSETVTSMNGVTIHAEKPLEFAAQADAVIVGSGIKTREIAKDADLLGRLNLDPSRQLIGAQCSGTLLLSKMGLLGDCPACTDLTTKPWVIEARSIWQPGSFSVALRARMPKPPCTTSRQSGRNPNTLSAHCRA